MTAASKKRPRPISLSQVVKQEQAALMAALTRSRAEASSVEVTRNAKGDVQLKVTVTQREGETITETSTRAQVVYDALVKKYPAPQVDK